MKKLVIFAVAAALCLAAKGARTVEPFPDGARVVFLGDSITQNGVAVTWVAAHYRKMYPKGNVRCFNVGISGGSVGAAHLYFDSWLAPLKPTHVVVGFGVNDAGAAVFRKGAKDKAAELKRIEAVAAAFEKRYCDLLDRIEALGAKVILRTPTPYDEFTKGPTANGKARVNAQAGRNDAQRRMAESVRKIAAARGLPLVDDFAALSPYMNGEDVPFEADRVHPDKLGLWRLARNLLSAQGLEIEKFRSIDEVAEEIGLTAWRAASVRLSNLLSAEFLIVRDESLDLDAKLARVRGWLAQNEKRKGVNPYVVARAYQFLEDKPREAELRAEEEAAWGCSPAHHTAAAVPKTATLIPAPREIRATGGEYWERKPPKLEKVAGIPPEGYELSITTNGITIRHSDDAGAFYANITLFHSGRWDAKAKCKVYPCLEIRDWPQFRWRGVHLDDSRRFFGKDAILQLLKQMSWFKLNVFHWHLTDDQLWSLEIPGYPELQKYGAEWHLKDQAKRWRGEKVGTLCYTANDVKEILAYAKERHITVVPEIELPGHSTAAILAYPELYCFPKEIYSKNRDVFTFNGGKLYLGVYCFGNPDTFRFLENVLDYVCELFPSEVIHIGGDECSRRNWKACPKCQAFIKEKGLKGVEDIQPWVTRHFVEYLAKKGRRTIGWDEIFMSSAWTKWDDFLKAGGDSFSSLVPKTTMGMCWRTWGPGALAANRGYEIVRCPGQCCYFDARQGLAEDPHFYFGGTVTTLEKVYRFDPYEGVEPAARKNVVGGQCCNWSTHTFCLDGLEWKMWPRGFALAEVLWTYPDPAKRDFKEFEARAANYRRRLIGAHVNCAPLK